jgi:hypothetical protein
MLKVIRSRKQAKLQWIQNLNQMKDYLNNLNMKLAGISRTNKWNNSRIKLMTFKKQ